MGFWTRSFYGKCGAIQKPSKSLRGRTTISVPDDNYPVRSATIILSGYSLSLQHVPLLSGGVSCQESGSTHSKRNSICESGNKVMPRRRLPPWRVCANGPDGVSKSPPHPTPPPPSRGVHGERGGIPSRLSGSATLSRCWNVSQLFRAQRCCSGSSSNTLASILARC